MYINSSVVALAGNLTQQAGFNTTIPSRVSLVPRVEPSQHVGTTHQVQTYENHFRIIQYQQTFFSRGDEGDFISPEPLLTETGMTHYIIATIHLSEDPDDIRINNHHYTDPRFGPLWESVARLQQSGVKVMAMIGGWGGGSFGWLTPGTKFNSHYPVFRRFLQEKNFDGVDLNVEVASVTLGTVENIIRNLRSDFGPFGQFIISMAPVANEMIDPFTGLARFSYFQLENGVELGQQAIPGQEGVGQRFIDFYNVQFYNNWGFPDLSDYNWVIGRGWSPSKIVMGTISHEGCGNRQDDENLNNLEPWISEVSTAHKNFGGVMGWERRANDLSWAGAMSRVLRPSGWIRPARRTQRRDPNSLSNSERIMEHVTAAVRRWSDPTPPTPEQSAEITARRSRHAPGNATLVCSQDQYCKLIPKSTSQTNLNTA